MMVIVGILFAANYQELSEGQVPDYSQATSTSFIVAAIYAAFMIGCGLRVFQLKLKSQKEEHFHFDFVVAEDS